MNRKHVKAVDRKRNKKTSNMSSTSKTLKIELDLQKLLENIRVRENIQKKN